MTALMLYGAFFLLYTHSINMNSQNFDLWNFVFDTDGPRIVRVFTDKNEITDAHRHPLYALFLKKPTRMLNEAFIDDNKNAALFVSAAVGCLSIPAVYYIFLIVLEQRMDALLFTVLFGCSSSMWLLSSLPETFSMNLAMVALAFYLQLRPSRGRLKNAVSFIALSFFAAGITISNIVYCFGGYVNSLRKQDLALREIVKLITVYACALLLLMGAFSFMQKLQYPNSVRLLTFCGLKGDLVYVTTDPLKILSPVRVITLFKTFMINNIIAPRAVIKIIRAFGTQWTIIGFTNSAGYVILALVYCYMAVMALRYIVRTKSYYEKDIQLAAGFIVFNLVFHSFYQALGIPFIYSIHAVFSLVFLMAWFYKGVNFKFKRLVLAACVIAIVANNAFFINRVNVLLDTNLAPIDHNIGNGR